MARILAFLMPILAAVGSLVCFRLATMERLGESLEIDKPVVDFGNVTQGSELQATFLIRNRHSRVVEVTDVVATCGCTQFELSKSQLERGDRCVLNVTWKTGSSRDRIRREILLRYVVADQGVQYTAPLVVTADVIPDFTYSPKEVNFLQGNASKQLVRFGPGRLSNVSLVRASCTQRAFKAVLLSGDNRNTVEVSFEPSERPDEEMEQYLVVETTSPNEPVCTIPLVVIAAKGANRRE